MSNIVFMYSISQNHESKMNPGNHISYSLPQITPGNHISYLLPQITPGNHNSYLLPQITLDMSTWAAISFFLLQNRQFLAYILYTNIKLTFYLISTLLRSCFFFWSIFTYTWRNVWQGQIRRSAFSFLKIYISICNRFNRMNILHLLKLLKKKVHIFNTKLITDKDMLNRKEQSIFFVQNHQLKVSTDVFNYS